MPEAENSQLKALQQACPSKPKPTKRSTPVPASDCWCAPLCLTGLVFTPCLGSCSSDAGFPYQPYEELVTRRYSGPEECYGSRFLVYTIMV